MQALPQEKKTRTFRIKFANSLQSLDKLNESFVMNIDA